MLDFGNAVLSSLKRLMYLYTKLLLLLLLAFLCIVSYSFSNSCQNKERYNTTS